jgi:tetratricopeptide (TPR) repeat protein
VSTWISLEDELCIMQPGRRVVQRGGAHASEARADAAIAQQGAFQFDVQLAQTLAQRGKPLEALAVLDRLLLRTPCDLGLLHAKGRCFEAASNIPGVSAAWQRGFGSPAQEQHEQHASWGGNLACTGHSSCTCCPLQAYATYMLALSMDSTYLPCIMSVGQLYKGRGMLQDAMAAFSRAYELAPGKARERGKEGGRCQRLCRLTYLPSGSQCASRNQHPLHYLLPYSYHADNSQVCEALSLILADLGTKLKSAGNIQEALLKYQLAVQV